MSLAAWQPEPGACNSTLPAQPAPPAPVPFCATAGSGAMLLKRAASAGLLLGGGMGASVALGPPAKKPCLDYVQLGPPHHPPAPALYSGTLYAAPEIVPVPLLTGSGGSGRLPDRLPLVGGSGALDELAVAGENGTQHGGSGYLQHLQSAPLQSAPTDSQLFGQLFQPGGGPDGPAVPGVAAAHTHSPRDQLEAAAAAAAGGAVVAYRPQSPREGSADNLVRRLAGSTMHAPRRPQGCTHGCRCSSHGNSGGTRPISMRPPLATARTRSPACPPPCLPRWRRCRAPPPPHTAAGTAGLWTASALSPSTWAATAS